MVKEDREWYRGIHEGKVPKGLKDIERGTHDTGILQKPQAIGYAVLQTGHALHPKQPTTSHHPAASINQVGALETSTRLRR